MVNGSTAPVCYKARVQDLPARIDVAIIGGGFAGCATAWALARRGVAAVVLEREPELRRFASGRGAGLGRQLAEDDHTTGLTVRGAALLRTTFAAAWTPTGGLLSFDDPAHAQAYRARAERLGVAVAEVDRAHVVRRWPAVDGLAIAAALAIDTDGVIDTGALFAMLAADARIVRGAGVVRVEPGGAGAQVVTTRGAVEARVVVDAAGAWAGATTGEPALEAYKRHLFVLEAAAPARAPFLWHLGADELYLRGDAGGTLACACDTVACPPEDPEVDPSGEPHLRARLGPAAPALGAARIVRQWAGHRSFAPDRRMRLGRDPRRPWLVWAAALGGHGATSAPAVGETVAEAVLAARS